MIYRNSLNDWIIFWVSATFILLALADRTCITTNKKLILKSKSLPHTIRNQYEYCAAKVSILPDQ